MAEMNNKEDGGRPYTDKISELCKWLVDNNIEFIHKMSGGCEIGADIIIDAEGQEKMDEKISVSVNENGYVRFYNYDIREYE